MPAWGVRQGIMVKAQWMERIQTGRDWGGEHSSRKKELEGLNWVRTQLWLEFRIIGGKQ